MKRIICILALSFSAFFFISCGESGITPKRTTIAGPLGNFYEVVNRPYKAHDGTVYIELKRIKDGLPEPWIFEYGKTVGWNDGEVEPKLTIEYYDLNGDIVGKSKTLDLGSDHFIDDQENLQRLVDLSMGETCSINFDMISNEAAQFALSSSFEYHPVPIASKQSLEDEAEYIEMIDKYEKLVDRFISIQKTAGSFDMGLYEEAMELSLKINELIDNTSSDLVERFLILEKKFSDAAIFGSKPDPD